MTFTECIQIFTINKMFPLVIGGESVRYEVESRIA